MIVITTNYVDDKAYQTDFRYLVRQTKQIALWRQPASKLYHFLFCMSSPKRFFTIPSLSLAWSPSINENSETSKNSSYKNIDYQSQNHLYMGPLRLSNMTFISWTYIPFQDDFDSFLFASDGWDMLLAAAVFFHGPLGIVFYIIFVIMQENTKLRYRYNEIIFCHNTLIIFCY